MSSKKQDKSIDAQRTELLALAQRNGYTITGEYVDEAISGDSTEKRVEFLRLRDDAAAGMFDRILVWDQDRLSRNDPLEIGFWLKPIRDAGVVVETPQGVVDWETLGGRLIYLISQEMKHAYLQDLSRNVARGHLASAHRDKRHGTGGGGGRLYGYTTHQDGAVEIVEDEALIVRRIYVSYLKPGASLRSVANSLNADGHRSMQGTPWTGSSVRRVLNNRKYTGAFIRFRHRTGKYHAIQDGLIVTRSSTDKPVEVAPLIVVPDSHERKIDQDSFEAAQVKLSHQQQITARRDGYQYLFSGLVRCGDCEKTMRGTPSKRKHAYSCGTYHAGGKAACFNNYVDEDRLLRGIVRLIQDRYCSPARIEGLRKALRRELAAERKQQTKPVDQRRLAKRISVLDHQLDQAAERVLVAPAALVDRLTAKLAEMQAERDRLQAELDATGRTETAPQTLDEETDQGARDATGAAQRRRSGRTPRDATDVDRQDRPGIRSPAGRQGN